MPSRILAFALLLGVVPSLTLAQAPAPSQEADGLVHVMLTLENQAVSLAYPPDLRADAGAHRPLLNGEVGARARIGTLAGHRALRIGTLAPDLEPPPAMSGEDDDAAPAPPPTHELWLVRTPDGWELEAYRSDREEVNTIPLAHRTGAPAGAMLSASLHATGAEDGRLELRWNANVWSADFRFDELPPTPRRPRVSGRGQAREADSDTTGFSRGTTLAERNETALVTPDGRQLTMLYWKGLDVEDEDYARLLDVDDGSVVPLVRAPPLRIKSDADLTFGSTDVPTGNLAPGFAGTYAVWLKKVDDGWRFVFNDEADSWGTQYDAELDAAEVAVDYTRTDGAFRPLGVTLAPTGPERGRITVHWGPHEWSAGFTF